VREGCCLTLMRADSYLVPPMDAQRLLRQLHSDDKRGDALVPAHVLGACVPTVRVRSAVVPLTA
jgi:hypothetical protein